MAIRILCVFLTLLIASSCQKPTKQELPVIVEQEISSGKLKASYINAGNNSPVILIVPGSGPTDRDGNSGLGLKSNAYKHLAEQLLGYNISTIRVDKRGMFGSSAAGDGNAVTVDIYAQDYRSWIDKIKEMTGANCVYLLGHSEGGIMVSAAAAGRDDVCGLILVAAPGRSFGNILREQLRANPANKPILEQAFGAIEKLEAGPKGVVISFKDNKFANPAGLIDFISSSGKTAKVRPDHKLVYFARMDKIGLRLKAVASMAKKLSALARA